MSIDAGNRRAQRIESYDWLKFFGALAIVIGHYAAMFPNGNQVSVFQNGLLGIIARHGGAAVALFLQISGYTTMSSFYNKKTVGGIKSYLLPKILRLWPLHFCTMLFCFAVQQIRIACGMEYYIYQANSLTDVIINSFFGGHFVSPELSLNGPAWTMSVTFFCYIAFWVIMKLDHKVNHNYVFAALTIFFTYVQSFLHMTYTWYYQDWIQVFPILWIVFSMRLLFLSAVCFLKYVEKHLRM